MDHGLDLWRHIGAGFSGMEQVTEAVAAKMKKILVLISRLQVIVTH